MTLDLDSDGLTGKIPSEIGELINLTDLNLRLNHFTTLPERIGDLNRLEKLYLSNNQLTTIPDSICNLTNLNWSSQFMNTSYSYIFSNQLCPPYTLCIENYLGVQDTSNCP